MVVLQQLAASYSETSSGPRSQRSMWTWGRVRGVCPVCPEFCGYFTHHVTQTIPVGHIDENKASVPFLCRIPEALWGGYLEMSFRFSHTWRLVDLWILILAPAWPQWRRLSCQAQYKCQCMSASEWRDGHFVSWLHGKATKTIAALGDLCTWIFSCMFFFSEFLDRFQILLWKARCCCRSEAWGYLRGAAQM